ncbi:MAG: sigma-54-dependent transcriptional regulator [Pseudodesulfovibrio sp.]|uniref:sigma-54-dependent transcriptional regulator n=1 Tax=Pseudodesulfovibrio sp. TaxID=2035812 RepID=UPI003D0BBEF4
MAKVLIIDDDKPTCEALLELVHNIGHDSDYALTAADGVRKAEDGDFDVVFLDIRLPDANGLSVLPTLRQRPLPPEVIILTGLGDPDGAELAIRNGAWDYLQKPLSPKKILLPLQRVLKYRDTLRKHTRLPETFDRCGIAGNSRATSMALEKLATAARSDASVLITGETGTGKELFAKALHHNSRRSTGPFIVVDCASIPATLLESTLFGHVKGAFTGADRASEGLVLKANKGTLFLDEIGEMSLDLQKRLLRVLQERRYRPVGAGHEVESDFRLVVATHRDLGRMVDDGLFRQDLLYRLGAMALELPPLRCRRDDLQELSESIVNRICDGYGIPHKKLNCEVMELFKAYDWPGNVRELGNVLESSIAAAYDMSELYAHNLPEQLRIRLLKESMSRNASSDCAPDAPGEREIDEAIESGGEILPYKIFRQEILSKAEERYFTRLFETCDGDVKRASKLSGLGKSRLYSQIKKYGLEKA